MTDSDDIRELSTARKAAQVANDRIAQQRATLTIAARAIRQFRAERDGMRLLADAIDAERGRIALDLYRSQQQCLALEGENDALKKLVAHLLAERDIGDMLHDAQTQERDRLLAERFGHLRMLDSYLKRDQHNADRLMRAQRWAQSWKASARGHRMAARFAAVSWRAGVAERQALKNLVAHLLAERDTLSRQLTELSHIVGTETPIAALDLATTWQAEKAHMHDMIAAAEAERDEARAQLAQAREWQR